MAKLRVKLNKYQIAAQEVTEVMGWEIDDNGNKIDVEHWKDEEIIVELRKAAAAREPGDEFTPPTAALLDELMVPEPDADVPVAKAEVKASTKAKAVAPKIAEKEKVEKQPEPKKEEPKAEVKKDSKKAVKKEAPVKEVPVKEVPQTPAPKAEAKVPVEKAKPVKKEAPKAEAKVAPKKEAPVKKAEKKVEKKVEKKAAPAKAKKDEGPKVRKPREQKTINHAMMLVRELVVKNPDVSIPELESELAKAGHTGVHKNSIVVRRMEMRHCLTVLNKLGLLKKSK